METDATIPITEQTVTAGMNDKVQPVCVYQAATLARTVWRAGARLSLYMLGIAVLIGAMTRIARSQTSNPTTTTTAAMTPQGMKQGSPAGSYSLSGFDNVNLFNGNLNVSLPLLKIGGRGTAGYTMMVATSTKKWQVKLQPGQDSNGPPYGNPSDRYIPLWKRWNTLEAGYGPGVMQGRKTGSETYLTRSCDTCPPTCNRRDPMYKYTLTRLTFITPDGTEYELRDEATNGKPMLTDQARCNDLSNTGAFRGRRFVSADGSAITFVSDADIYDEVRVNPSGSWLIQPSGILYMRDGTRYQIEDGHVSWIQDRNGNRVTFSYGTVTEITDSLNRKINIEYNVTEDSYPEPHDRITYYGFGGAPRFIRVFRTNLSHALRQPDFTIRSYPQLFPELNGSYGFSSNFDPVVVSQIMLPDNRSYKIFYNSYAEVARVELPTGGAFEYDMVPGSGVIGSAGATDSGTTENQIYRRLKERRSYTGLTADTLDSRTVYTTGDGVLASDSAIQVEQYDRDGRLLALSTHYFNGSAASSLFTLVAGALYSPENQGRELSTEVLDISNRTTVLQRVANRWEQREPVAWVGHLESSVLNYPPPGLSIQPDNDPRLTRVVTTLETNQVSQQEFGYDRYNNQKELREYDYGAGAPGALVRRTVTEYLTVNPVNGVDYVGSASDIHVRNLPLKQYVYAGTSETPTAKTEYEYDNYTNDSNHHELTLRGSISGLADLGPFRGNVTGTSVWLDTANSWLHTYQQYDVAGNLVKAIDARGYASSIEYEDCFGGPDGDARLNSAPEMLGSRKTFAFPTSLTNALGQTVYGQYDYFIGKPVDGEDLNGVVSSGSYNDWLDRPTQVIRAANLSFKNQTSFNYDDANHTITTTSDLNNYGDNLLKSQLIYDGLGRTVETRQYETATAFITSSQTYDGLGRVKRAYNPFRNLSETTYGWAETTYDSLSRVAKVETFDREGLSTGAVINLYNGNEVAVTDQQGKSRKVVTDALGRLIGVFEDPNGLNYQTSYEYDALGNLRTVLQGEQTRSFVYDSLSRLSSATSPESGTIKYQYDANGNLVLKVEERPGGTPLPTCSIPYSGDRIATCFDYDAINRVKTRTYNDGTPNVSYTYDTLSNGKGRLTSVSNSVSETSYTGYDPLGGVTGSRQTTAGQSYTFGYSYDLAGHLISETYPSGRTITTGIDQAGRISSVNGQKTGEANKSYASGFIYASHGAATQMTMGNGTMEKTSFNSRLQVTQIQLLKQGALANPDLLLGLDYNYGLLNPNGTLDTTRNNGNLQGQKITAPNLTLTQNYNYDGLNRLERADEINNGTLSWQQNYKYDRYGNRNFAPGTTFPAMPPTLVDAINNPLINPATNQIDKTKPGQADYQYDAAGNLTSVPAHNFIYDAENRQTGYDGGNPASGVGASYTYDGDGHRVKKVTPTETTIFVYDVAGNLIAEYSNNARTGGNGTQYIMQDTLGSPRVITDSSGTVKERHDYMPFGEEAGSGFGGRSGVLGYGVDTLRKKFTGYERDFESGLDYAQARYYSSAHGRFTSIDPLITSAVPTSPKTWNRYAYALNNPLRFVDPMGLRAELVDPDDGQENRVRDTTQSPITPPKNLEVRVQDPNGKPVTILLDPKTRELVPGQTFQFKGGAMTVDSNGQLVAEKGSKIEGILNSIEAHYEQEQDDLRAQNDANSRAPAPTELDRAMGGIAGDATESVMTGEPKTSRAIESAASGPATLIQQMDARNKAAVADAKFRIGVSRELSRQGVPAQLRGIAIIQAFMRADKSSLDAARGASAPSIISSGTIKH